MATNAPTQPIALGSLKPGGTRRFIYNSDPSNTMCHLSDPVARPDELRQIVRLYAGDGKIDTLVQEVFSQGMTHFWRTDNCSYDSRSLHQRLVPMMDDGVMPVEVLIDECHDQGMEFLAGWRMNDRHGHNHSFFEKLSREKPEWILTDYKPSFRCAPPESHKYGCSLNYAIQEVRDWLLSLMEEMANRFDIDGIEFNFTRGPECFPRGEAAASCDIMTGFLRQVREMLNEAGKKRSMTPNADGSGSPERGNRNLLLGVRVFQQVATCTRLGFDVPAWIGEGLVDYVAPSDWCFTNFNAPYEEFASLARAHHCHVYPEVQPRLGYQAGIAMRPARYRAAVRNFYGAGADGFSTQNFNPFYQEGADRQDILDCLEELKSPEALAASTDRHYVFLPLWGEDIKIYEKQEVVLSRKEIGRRGEFRCRICEEFPADPILPVIDEGTLIDDVTAANEGSGLIFFPLGLLEDDEITVDINGKVIPPEQLRWKWYHGWFPSCTIALSSPPFVYGDNYLGVTITKPADEGNKRRSEIYEDATGDIRIERVECIVREPPGAA